MIPRGFLEPHLPKIVVALLLTFGSGLVDIVGYLGIFHFFTAHLTGTTVQLGRSLASRNWVQAVAAMTIVVSFVCGSILGRALIEAGSRKKFRRIASFTLALEAIWLAVAAQGGWGLAREPYWSLSLVAASMGIQTATLTGIGPLTVHTTFVTGMLNKMAQLMSHIAFRGYDLWKSKAANSTARREQKQEIEMLGFLACIWIVYVLGAAVGTVSFETLRLRALFVAVGLLAVAFVIDEFKPLSIEEEKEQSEQ